MGTSHDRPRGLTVHQPPPALVMVALFVGMFVGAVLAPAEPVRTGDLGSEAAPVPGLVADEVVAAAFIARADG